MLLEIHLHFENPMNMKIAKLSLSQILAWLRKLSNWILTTSPNTQQQPGKYKIGRMRAKQDLCTFKGKKYPGFDIFLLKYMAQ